MIWYKFVWNTFHRHFYNVFNLRYYFSSEIQICFIFENGFNCIIRQLISIFKCSKILRKFLDCIICQMDLTFVHIVVIKIKCFATRSYVSFFEEIYFMFLCNKDPASYVKFSILYEKRFFNVFLNDEWTTFKLFLRGIFFFFQCWLWSIYLLDFCWRFFSGWFSHLSDLLSHFLNCVKHINSSSSVKPCSFKKPNIISIITAFI